MARTYLDALGSGDPEAPWFARMAVEFLTRNEPAKAAELCLDGLRRHPDYGTGYLVLGKCYAALGRSREALLAFRKAHEVVPDNAAVRALLATQQEQERQAFEGFCLRRRDELRRDNGRLTLEQFLAGGDTESSVDYLLKQLDEVRKRRPPELPAEEEPGAAPEGPPSAKIITVTLAEIYASQGQFTEAIAAYQKLIELRPDEEARYAARIRELETHLRGTE